MSQRLRVAMFTHDAYGVGHIRRATRIARALAAHDPAAAILLISGSPATRLFADLPPNADYVKIPTIVTSGVGDTRPPMLPIGLAGLAGMRAAMVRDTLEVFAPDVVLIDNFPLGTRFELLPALLTLRAMGTPVVLGLRDIVDPPERVRADWQRDGVYEVLDRYYDRIVVYGVPEILDAAEAYGLPPAVAAKVLYCGFVTEVPSAPPAAAPDVPGSGDLLATAGAGRDGLPLLDAFIRAMAELPGRRATVIGGESMSVDDRATLQAMCAAEPRITWLDDVPDLPARIAVAELVVAMAGYNTALEIVAAGTRAVLVPRTWRSGEHATRAGTRRTDGEQLLRAAWLARLGLVQMLHPAELSPGRLAAAVREALAAPRPEPGGGLALDGADRVARQLLGLARGDRDDAT